MRIEIQSLFKIKQIKVMGRLIKHKWILIYYKKWINQLK